MTLANYAPVGGGIMILSQAGFGVLALAIVLGLMLTSSARARHIKYWLALACAVQAIPAAVIMVAVGPFATIFDVIWLTSMALTAAGLGLIVVWPIPDVPPQE